MKRNSVHLKRLFLGEDKRRTRVALVLAAGLLIVSMTVDYLALSAEIGAVDATIFGALRELYTLDPIWENGVESATELYAAILVVGLAAIHAYYNEGYLTSVLLASALPIGAALWSIHGMDEYLVLTPELVFERVFPEAPLLATLGFVLGLGLRIVRNRTSPTAEPHAPGR